MSKKNVIKPVAAVVGAALVGSLSAVSLAQAAENPFGATALSSGYMLLAESAPATAAAPAEAKTTKEGKCGGEKATKEGKCGEGKCGGEKAATEGKCGGEKATKEGKCGEGKCGGAK
ncbi:MAG: low-complexity protein [Chromatiaceae bacterium]|jgi:uncharacterized low-complexity protein|nr:low-complexity protein [Chromatiaceae bacterium]